MLTTGILERLLSPEVGIGSDDFFIVLGDESCCDAIERHPYFGVLKDAFEGVDDEYEPIKVFLGECPRRYGCGDRWEVDVAVSFLLLAMKRSRSLVAHHFVEFIALLGTWLPCSHRIAASIYLAAKAEA